MILLESLLPANKRRRDLVLTAFKTTFDLEFTKVWNKWNKDSKRELFDLSWQTSSVEIKSRQEDSVAAINYMKASQEAFH